MVTLETRDGVTRVICGKCTDRPRPILEIANGELSIESKHGSSKHRNILNSEDLKLIQFVMWRQTHPAKEYW